MKPESFTNKTQQQEQQGTYLKEKNTRWSLSHQIHWPFFLNLRSSLLFILVSTERESRFPRGWNDLLEWSSDFTSNEVSSGFYLRSLTAAVNSLGSCASVVQPAVLCFVTHGSTAIVNICFPLYKRLLLEALRTLLL